MSYLPNKNNSLLLCVSVSPDSRPQIDPSRFDSDEADTANILLSLGNSRSGTPACFTPIQQSVPHSPRSHTPSPAHFSHRNAHTFTPISQYPNSHQAGGSAVGTPNRWGSATPLSGRSSAEIASPAVQFQQQSHNFATPVSPNKLKLKMEHARNQSRDVSRSDSNDSGVDSVNRSPTPNQHGVTPSPGHVPTQHVMSPPNIMSPPAARQQVTQYFQSPEKSHFEFPPPPSDSKLRAALLTPRTMPQYQTATAQETQTSPIIDTKPVSQHTVYADKIPSRNLTKEFEKDQAKLQMEGIVRRDISAKPAAVTLTLQQHEQGQQTINDGKPIVAAGTQEVNPGAGGTGQQVQSTPFQAAASHPTPTSLLPVMPAGGGDKEENREQRPASKLHMYKLSANSVNCIKLRK